MLAISEDSGFWGWINYLAGICKTNAPTKLTMTCLIDDGNGMLSVLKSADSKLETRNLDVFGINSYRGTIDSGFGTLFADYQGA